MVALTPMGGQVVEDQSARSIMMETRSSMTRLTTGDVCGVGGDKKLVRADFSLGLSMSPSKKVAASGAPRRL